jgi:hypothetical protein
MGPRRRRERKIQMEVDSGEVTENRKYAIVTELTFLNIEPYCIPPSGGMVHRKRGIK